MDNFCQSRGPAPIHTDPSRCIVPGLSSLQKIAFLVAFFFCVQKVENDKSKGKFYELPEVYEKGRKICNEKLARRKALPLSEIATMNLGSTQEQRKVNLFQCVEEGNLARLVALFDAGIDIDVVNEYGQSVVFLCVLHKQFHVLPVLKVFGADFKKKSNCGTSFEEVLAAVAAKGSAGALQALRDSMQDISYNVVEATVENLVNKFVDLSHVKVTPIVDFQSNHPGSGACLIDHAFKESFLTHIHSIRERLPLIDAVNVERNARRFYYDALGRINETLSYVLKNARGTNITERQHVYFLPHMRILEYEKSGAWCPPHTDINRTDKNDMTSTHTFILYLEDVLDDGGGTAILESLPKPDSDEEMEIKVLVTPKRGRLLFYPHATPHAGMPILEKKKILLRGEIYIGQVILTKQISIFIFYQKRKWKGGRVK